VRVQRIYSLTSDILLAFHQSLFTSVVAHGGGDSDSKGGNGGGGDNNSIWMGGDSEGGTGHRRLPNKILRLSYGTCGYPTFLKQILRICYPPTLRICNILATELYGTILNRILAVLESRGYAGGAMDQAQVPTGSDSNLHDRLHCSTELKADATLTRIILHGNHSLQFTTERRDRLERFIQQCYHSTLYLCSNVPVVIDRRYASSHSKASGRRSQKIEEKSWRECRIESGCTLGLC
jgi:hypothetical protein